MGHFRQSKRKAAAFLGDLLNIPCSPSWTIKIQTQVSLLLRGRFSGNKILVGMCTELYQRREWLWTFIKTQGIEPTNNAAERALRPAVIYRKLSFGTQSDSGVERKFF